MAAISSSNNDVIARLVPGGAHSLAHLSDDELLANTRRLVGKSNQLFAALLVHLAEVETRGVHRTRRCASLYTYCVYELRFSEDAAARRSSAARLVKQFPSLFDAIANGEPNEAYPEPNEAYAEPTRQRGRYIPAAERREVFQRDSGRCTYIDLRGERCCETRYLELHHLQPFAKGGASVAANLTLRCAAHNALAAEQDFGREACAEKRDSLRHESFASQLDVSTSRRACGRPPGEAPR